MSGDVLNLRLRHWSLLHCYTDRNAWCHKDVFLCHHHKHQGLDPLIRSVSRVRTALANVSTAFQLFSFLMACSSMLSKGFGFVAFFASVKASSFCIHPSCVVCM